MAQRVLLAQAYARGSRFLLADEPGTGTDAVVRRSVFDALCAHAHSGCGVLLITHDLRLLAEVADRVVPLEDGRSAAPHSPEALEIAGPWTVAPDALRPGGQR